MQAAIRGSLWIPSTPLQCTIKDQAHVRQQEPGHEEGPGIAQITSLTWTKLPLP